MLTHQNKITPRPNASASAATGLAAALLALLGAVSPATADPARMIGTWIDHTGRGAVEFTRCGEGLCGRIVWMKDPNDKSGKPLTDGYNPNPTLRNTPICGLQIVGDAKPQRDGSLDQGWIYDPEKGERYSVEISLISPNILRVHGYLGIKLLGETLTWKRATGSLARCTA
jgi:uncharacterized protein (DUF2147 family)